MMLTPEEYRAIVAADMTEADLQARVIRLAKLAGWVVYHAPDNRPGKNGRVQVVTPGFPDLVLVHEAQARIMYRELKRKVGRVSPDQVEWLRLLTHAGADAGVWRPADLLEGRIAVELSRRVHHV